MGSNVKVWHPNFIKYMDGIVADSAYKGLAINRKGDGSLTWVASARSSVGQARILWIKQKAVELGIADEPGMYAKVMLILHPTKEKVCQICGENMSLYYIYPNKWLIVSLEKVFNYVPTVHQSISDICDDLLMKNIDESTIKHFLLEKFKLPDSYLNYSIQGILHICEEKCRSGENTMLGPGAMSNFPDRFDGFHTYNRCCRVTEDTGRHADNLKTYTKDRRAYEYWSDGNIHAANKFMGSSLFQNTSADHVGPISLGFVHDPRYLRPMSKGDNSAKRDRLSSEDIDTIISIENTTSIYPMTWYSRSLWEFIKLNYQQYPYKIDSYRQVLKQNMNNFMDILWHICNKNNNNGTVFLIEYLLKPKFEYFIFDYVFNELGIIVAQSNRNITDSTRKEMDRFIRIAFESIFDYHEKENRNTKSTLDAQDLQLLQKIYSEIEKNPVSDLAYESLHLLMRNIQSKLISTL